MHSLLSIALLTLFLLGLAFLTAFNGALRRLQLQNSNFDLTNLVFFYRRFHSFFISEYEYEGLLCATMVAQNVTRFTYITIGILSITWSDWWFSATYFIITSLVLLSFSFAIGEYVPRILSALFPEKIMSLCAPIASVFLCLTFPFTFLVLKLSGSQFRYLSFEEPINKTKRELIEIIQRTQLTPELNLHEKKLIESVLRFKDRIAREVMVPRVDVFSLSADTPIIEASKLIQTEGYSRIPIYRNTVDNIVGVLMYKDILNQFMEYEKNGNNPAILQAPIETIQKGVLYTPETKKISNLLLEFRKKQVHLAILVDEYGGTEGIVTIEDILEEIVGEIEDEYDEEEEEFFVQLDGSWIVDARMNILDAEEQFGIKIPQEGDYDTIGGYVFHCAGSIPSKGFIIHHEGFEMEILRSDERRVHRVRVKPLSKPEQLSGENKSFT
jgi:putative hemolysin